MVEDVALSAKKTLSGNVPVYCFANSLGVPRVRNVIERYNAMKNGEMERVF
jgi:hypothetical protein